MSAASRLALPGEGPARLSLRPSRAVLGTTLGALWLLLQSSFLPSLHLTLIPFDPIVPLLVAWCLSSQRAEALWLAIALGCLADSLSGASSSLILVRYLLIVVLASPAQGHVVLRDRWMPTVGVAILCLVSGLLVYLFPALLGAELNSDLRALPGEVLSASLASAVLWPVLIRIAGSSQGRGVRFGRHS